MKYKLTLTAKYKKTLRLAQKRNLDLSELQKVTDMLEMGEKLPVKYRDHALAGNFTGFRECHIKGDWLLIYRIVEDKLLISLYATGTHSDLLNM
jgi:mRNA interferase YafQ